MAAKGKKIEGLNVDLQTVPLKDNGALYQLVEGDPTNAEFQEKMEASRKAAKDMED